MNEQNPESHEHEYHQSSSGHHHSSHHHHHSHSRSSSKKTIKISKKKSIIISGIAFVAFLIILFVFTTLDKNSSKNINPPNSAVNQETVDEFGFSLESSTKKKKAADDSGRYIIRNTEGILPGLQTAYEIGSSKVVVEAGTYDVISEYKKLFGNDYFDNYEANYNGLKNGKWDYGIWLDNIEISFSPAAKVVCYYDGANENVVKYFSPFAVGNNVVIDGLVLDSKECRYGIHPDFGHDNSDVTYLTIKNCDLKHYASTIYDNNQAIGAGLNEHCVWTIENNIFRSETGKHVMRIHNNRSSDSQSKVVVKDNYIEGEGYFLFNSFSTSAYKTQIIVCGNSWKHEPELGKETADSNDNIIIYSWGNEMR